MTEIAFIDLQIQQQKIKNKIDESIRRVLDHGLYILGPEVTELEEQLAQFSGAKFVLSCSSGTDALAMILMAKGVGTGDAVIVPSFTFAATAEVVAWLGATPIFVDVLPDTFNIDPSSVKQGIDLARKMGLKPKVIITVDLFGQPADFDSINEIANQEGLWILSDAAQSFGASYKSRKVGTLGLASATSFFPAKPLGCYGDGGAIFTEDASLNEILKSVRVHGQGQNKYDNVRIGINGRLDTLQAAILIEKLKIFPEELMLRNKVADTYTRAFKAHVQVPTISKDNSCSWAQYSVILKNQTREAVVASLKKQGVPTAIHYPKPLHQQPAYSHYPVAAKSLPASEYLAENILSLPMHPYLDISTQNRIIEAFLQAIK